MIAKEGPRLVLCLAILAQACGTGTSSTSTGSDGTHYIAAMDAGSLESAVNACLKIQHSTLQGECILYVARDAAREGSDATTLCEKIEHKGWQQACFFELADAAGLIEQPAIEACARAPDFADRCLSHAIVRHAGRVANDYTPGQESEFIVWIQTQAQVYGLSESERVVADVLAQHISSRACAGHNDEPCPPFALSTCGEAPPDICRQAYRVTARSAVRTQDITSLCTAPIERQRLMDAGLPVWEDDFARPAIETWGHICQALAGITPPPSPALHPNTR